VKFLTRFNWIHLAGCCDHINEPSSFIQGGDLLTSRVTVSFSRRTLPHVVIHFVSVQRNLNWIRRHEFFREATFYRFLSDENRLVTCNTESRPALGSIQPPIQQVPGALSAGVKRLEREADHSPSSSAEVKNVWRYTSAPSKSWRHGA
jgi:hypothetical protein